MWIKRILIGMTLILVPLFLIGCGVEQGKYDSLLSDMNKAQEELQSSKAELTTVQTELEKTQSDLSTLQTEKTALLSEKESLEADHKKLDAEKQVVSKELVDLKKVYPLKDFSSLRELQEWLTKNDVSKRPETTTAEAWYSKALEIQEDAMKDGYLISVDEDSDDEGDASVYNVAIINGDIWYWDPETDEPIHDTSWGKVK